MHVLMCLIFIVAAGAGYKDSMNVGTVLFRDMDMVRECWSREEYALLKSRRIMNSLIPQEILNDDTCGYVSALIEYFHICARNVWRMSKGRARHIQLLALADVFGGFLHVYALPLTKQKYYGGLVHYEDIQNLYNLYEDLLNFLMTDGSNWKKPRSNFPDKKLFRELVMDTNEDMCEKLITIHKGPQRSIVQVPLPLFDDPLKPRSALMPYKVPGMDFVNLHSKESADMLQLYYITSVKCLNSSLESLTIFKLEFYRWLKSQVLPRLEDTQWYPAFGGVLSILATLEREDINQNEASLRELYISKGYEANFNPNGAGEITNGTTSIGKLLKNNLYIIIIGTAIGILLKCLCSIWCYIKFCRNKGKKDVEETKGGDSKLFDTAVHLVNELKDKKKRVGSSGSSVMLNRTVMDASPSGDSATAKKISEGEEDTDSSEISE